MVARNVPDKPVIPKNAVDSAKLAATSEALSAPAGALQAACVSE
jgi:hypothetical protein